MSRLLSKYKLIQSSSCQNWTHNKLQVASFDRAKRYTSSCWTKDHDHITTSRSYNYSNNRVSIMYVLNPEHNVTIIQLQNLITVGITYILHCWVRGDWSSITILNDLKSIFVWIQAVDDRSTDHSISLNFFFSFLRKLWAFQFYTQKKYVAPGRTVRTTVRSYQKLSNGHVQHIKIRGISMLFQLQLHLYYIVVRNLFLTLTTFNFFLVFVFLIVSF